MNTTNIYNNYQYQYISFFNNNPFFIYNDYNLFI